MKYDTPVSNYSDLWFREINEMERDICDPSPETSVSEGVHPIEEVREEAQERMEGALRAQVSEEITALSSYPLSGTGLFRDRASESFLTRRQAG